MPDSLGGSQSTSMQIPEWLEQPARRNIGRAEEISQLGYMPNFGPQVAALSNQQTQAMRNQNRMANAYGMGGGGGLNIPKPQTFAGGVQGYSSFPMFKQMRDTFGQRRPGQMDAYKAQFINPRSGAAATSAFAGAPTQAVDPTTGQIVDAGMIGSAGNDLDTGAPWGVGGEGVGGEVGYGGYGGGVDYGGGEPGGTGYGDGIW